MHHWLRTLLLLPLLALASGCATSTLWTASTPDSWNQPATNANLRLFAAGPSRDFLVVYNQYSERHESPRTRAYFLNQNLECVAQKRAPHFVSATLAQGLVPVPVFSAPPLSDTNGLTRPFAVYSTKSGVFVLYYKNGGSDFYHLPVYNDSMGKYQRAASKTLAVTEEAGILIGLAGFLYVYVMAQNGSSIPH
jgi:hypothetical protein